VIPNNFGINFFYWRIGFRATRFPLMGNLSWSFVFGFLFLVGLAAVRGEEPELAASPENRLPNGSFEVDSTGWMLVESMVAGTQWGVTADGAQHGLHALVIDRRGSLGGGRTRLQGPWFEHGETALLVTAMVRADKPGRLSVGLTHGEIAGWKGKNPISARETFEIGPEWRQITLRVPRALNRPRGRFGTRNMLGRTSPTKSMVYFELDEANRVWIDAVQVNESPKNNAIAPPAFRPAAEVEMGWRVEHGGIFHDRPRFEAVIANHGEAPLSGSLEAGIEDFFGETVQQVREPVEVAPGGVVTVPVALQSDDPGFFKAALRLSGPDGTELARENLSFVRVEEGPGSDAMAITSSIAFSDDRVNVARSLDRLGFTQMRVYNFGSWNQCQPTEGEWVSPAPFLDAFMGGSGLRTQVNLCIAPDWVLGPEGTKFAYPPGHLDTYAAYVRRAVKEMRPWLSSAAFSNEPNAHFHGSVNNYLAYSRALHENVKAVAPEVDVAGIQPGSGGRGADIGYVLKILEPGGEDFVRSMDVLAVQTHPGAGMPVEKNGWAPLLAELRDVARQYGIKRIWSTEMGFPAHAPEEAHMPIRESQRTQLAALDPTERTQADRITRAALFGLASTFERVYLFHFTPVSPSNGIIFPWGMSRANHLATPRPALAALSFANRMLVGTDARAVRAFATPGLWGATFSGAGRRVDALWSVTGPQHVWVDAGLQAFNAMGKPIPLGENGGALIELDGSPVYLVGTSAERDPVKEVLSVSWDPQTVWSGDPFRGEIHVSDTASLTALRVTDGKTGRELWSAKGPVDAGTSLGDRFWRIISNLWSAKGPVEAGTTAFAFDLEAPHGLLPLAIEGTMADGRTFVRRFEPMVLGNRADREIYERGEPALLEDFEAMEVQGVAGRSARGIAWSAEMLFPWHHIYGKTIKRSLTATGGTARVTVNQPVGKPNRGSPNWPALNAQIDEPRNWMAYRGLRIRYRMDREDRDGRIVIDPDLSASGISMRMGDADGNSFFIRPDTGLSFQRDGDWYVATLIFDEVPGLLENRVNVNFLSLWANASADDDHPFGLSFDRIEVLPRIEEKHAAPAVQPAPDQINYDE
jgi:hypothetical protein